MNYKDLSRYAYHEWTPQVLALLWETRTNVNPVEKANELQRRDSLWSIFNAIFIPPLILSVVLGVICFLLPFDNHSPDVLSLAIGGGRVVAVVGGLLSCAGWVGFQLMRYTMIGVTKEEKEQVALYGSDLGLYVQWAGPPMTRHRVDEPTHRKTAKTILVTQAAHVVRSNRAAARAADPMAALDHNLEAGKHLSEFKARLMVLNRLSIADLDRTSYFDAAEKLVDAEEERQLQSEAAKRGLAPMPAEPETAAG